MYGKIFYKKELSLMLEYDRNLALDFQEVSSVVYDSHTVKDINYLSPCGGTVPAYLVVPKTSTPSPAVIFMHPGQGNRKTFLPEAEKLALNSVFSLLIDAPFVRGTAPKTPSTERELHYMVEAMTDIQKYIQTILDIRRGIDLLSTFNNVDSKQIAYIGHSLGATWGGVLAGVEKRIKAYILMAGFSSVSMWHKTSDHPLAVLIRNMLSEEKFHSFISALEPLDAIHYIDKAVPASLFFQFAYNDEFVSRDQANSFYTNANLPKEIIWYETDHLFTACDTASEDRIKWLFKNLGLKLNKQ
ncbi:acetylxylan esterase [Bacillus pfraonensis]|uniref:alpha/beta hydrolase n=2 Tax=Bacillus TaxID=1386 RepID=UPI003012E947